MDLCPASEAMIVDSTNSIYGHSFSFWSILIDLASDDKVTTLLPLVDEEKGFEDKRIWRYFLFDGLKIYSSIILLFCFLVVLMIDLLC